MNNDIRVFLKKFLDRVEMMAIEIERLTKRVETLEGVTSATPSTPSNDVDTTSTHELTAGDRSTLHELISFEDALPPGVAKRLHGLVDYYPRNVSHVVNATDMCWLHHTLRVAWVVRGDISKAKHDELLAALDACAERSTKDVTSTPPSSTDDTPDATRQSLASSTASTVAPTDGATVPNIEEGAESVAIEQPNLSVTPPTPTLKRADGATLRWVIFFLQMQDNIKPSIAEHLHDVIASYAEGQPISPVPITSQDIWWFHYALRYAVMTEDITEDRYEELLATLKALPTKEI